MISMLACQPFFLERAFCAMLQRILQILKIARTFSSRSIRAIVSATVSSSPRTGIN